MSFLGAREGVEYTVYPSYIVECQVEFREDRVGVGWGDGGQVVE